jgi:hypothetical protein
MQYANFHVPGCQSTYTVGEISLANCIYLGVKQVRFLSPSDPGGHVLLYLFSGGWKQMSYQNIVCSQEYEVGEKVLGTN